MKRAKGLLILVTVVIVMGGLIWLAGRREADNQDKVIDGFAEELCETYPEDC